MGQPSRSAEQPAAGTMPAQARCISVLVQGALYGLCLDEVQEVLGMRPLSRVFHAPPVVAGVMNLRGDVLPVLELGVLLGVRAAPPARSDESRIVVVRERAGKRRRAGLSVDALGPLREMGSGGLGEPPSTLSETTRALVVGVIGESPPCCVLSVQAALGSPMLAALAADEPGDER
jgi:purine-binding chemotaxis protein CheW